MSSSENNATRAYIVEGMTCGHCTAAVTDELTAVDGVETVNVDLETKRVEVRGSALDDQVLVAAIDEAGYDAVPTT